MLPVVMGRSGTAPGKRKSRGPDSLPVGAEDLQQSRGEHDVAILPALAVANADHHALAVDVGDLQLGDFGDAQAGGIGGHEDGAMLDIWDGRKEANDLVRAEDDRESCGAV